MADHDVEDPNLTRITVYTGCGEQSWRAVAVWHSSGTPFKVPVSIRGYAKHRHGTDSD